MLHNRVSYTQCAVITNFLYVIFQKTSQIYTILNDFRNFYTCCYKELHFFQYSERFLYKNDKKRGDLRKSASAI